MSNIKTCLDCIFSTNRGNKNGIIYCLFKQLPHNALEPCKDLFDDDKVKLNDQEILSIAREKRKSKRHKNILCWTIITSIIFFMTLLTNIIFKSCK
jgi:hypothetical protein